MKMVARDLDVIRLVGSFSMLTAGQIDAILFADNASRTPATRVLKRLTDDKMLARITRRVPGGAQGGSPQYVYQLGPEGWRLFSRSRWRPRVAVDYHALAIGDAYVALLRSQEEHQLEVTQVTTEPETHTLIGGADLRPDLFLEVRDHLMGRTHHLWLEVDLSTERPKQLSEMLYRYKRAWEESGIFYEINDQGAEVEVKRGRVPFPRVVFLVPNEPRRKVLTGLIRSLPAEEQELFTVYVHESFPQALLPLIRR
jgi:hypothetical protein